MRAKNILHRTLSVGLIALWAGCAGGRSSPKSATNAEPCTDDIDCKDRFCDNGFCIPLPGYYGYGNTCMPPDKDWRPDEACPHGYLCLAGRCRSCRSDDECTVYFGVGKCVVVNDPTRQLGYTCFPDTTRGFPDAACEKDEQCWSGFCDRWRCAPFDDLYKETYGLACVPGLVPEYDRYGLEHVKECTGYLCLEQRCRSCVSDEECQRGGAQNLKCVALTEFMPGKLCATPERIAKAASNSRRLKEGEPSVPSIAP